MVAFLHNWYFPFFEPRKERLHSYQTHLFTQQSDNAPGCLVTSRINVARCFFQKTSGSGGGPCTTYSGTGRPALPLEILGLYRPPSIICLGTGRPAHLFKSMGLYRPPSIICSGTGRPAHPFKSLGLYRPPSIICSGTGRPARPFERLGTVSTSLLRRRRA